MSNQLIKNTTLGTLRVYPKTHTEGITDKSTGKNLVEILNSFNMYFLSYVGNTFETRCQVPKDLRREGLWITYIDFNHKVITEWYNSDNIDNETWGVDTYWRQGSNKLIGDISISVNGNWVINGKETEFKATGDPIKPLLRVNFSANKLQVSYDDGNKYENLGDNPVYTLFRIANNKLLVSTDLGKTWTDTSEPIAAWFRWASGDTADSVGKIQISRDELETWIDLSPNIVNNLYIKGYVAAVGNLPSNAALGDIYMVGPTYDESDTTHDYPHYRMWVKLSSGWVDNGEYLSNVLMSLTTGLETGITMSLKAITDSIVKQGIYDVSANNDGAVFESLSALLNNANLSTLIPTSVRCGGMNIRFIQGSEQSSGNNYVRYNYLKTDTTNSKFTNVDNWQIDTDNSISEISETISTADGNEIVVTDDNDNPVFEITEDYVNAKNLKSNDIDLLIEINKKVTSVEGKQLSTEDYTTNDKTALHDLESFIKNSTTGGEDEILIIDSNDNPVVEITEGYVNAKSLKSDGKKVVTEDEVDGLSSVRTYDTSDEIEINNDDETETFTKFGNYGVKSKGYYDLNGKNILDYILDESGSVEIDVSGVQDTDGKISDSDYIYNSSNSYKHKILSVTPSTKYRISANVQSDLSIFFMKSSSLVNGEEYPYSDYIKNKILIEKGTTEVLTTPPDVQYMYWCTDDGADIESLYNVGHYEKKRPVTLIEKIADITNESCKYAIHQYCEGWEEINYPLGENSEDLENDVRIPAAVSMSFAYLMRSGYFDQSIVCQTQYGLKKQIHRLSMAVINCHRSVNITGSTWNHDWQAGLFATYAAAGVILYPDVFTSTEIERCKTMLMDIADFQCSRDTSTMYWKNTDGEEIHSGDTQADNMSWDAGLIMLAAYMCPDAPNIELYKRKAIEFNIITFSTPNDRDGDKFVNGYSLQTLQGSNYDNDGTTMNHGRIHPDYMASYSNLIGVIPIILESSEIPVAVIHNIDKISYGFTDKQFVPGERIGNITIKYPGGAIFAPKSWNIYYPMGNDWGGTPRLFQNEILFGCICKAFNAYPNKNWEDIVSPYVNHFLQMQSRFKDGRTFGTDSENNYLRGREFTISSVVGASLIMLSSPIYLDESGIIKYNVSGSVHATVNGEDYDVNNRNLVFIQYWGDSIKYSVKITNNTYSINLPGGQYLATIYNVQDSYIQALVTVKSDGTLNINLIK